MLNFTIKTPKKPLHQRFQIAKFLTYCYSELVSIQAQYSCIVKKKKKRFFILISLSFSLSRSLFLFASLSSLSPFFSMLFVSLFLIATVYLVGATASLALFKITLAHPVRLPHWLFKIASPKPPQALSRGYEWVGFVKLDLGCGWVSTALSGFMVVGMS